MLISEAFSKYNAKQKNVNWSVSAFNDKGELVVSLWEQYLKNTGNKSITYIDKVSRWSGLGNKEFIENLNIAQQKQTPIRIVIAKTNDPQVVANGGDASKLKNTFSVKTDWIGELSLWNGDDFEIKFSQET